MAQNVGTISSGQETWNGAGERNREGDSRGGSGPCHLGLRLAPYSLGRTRHRDFAQSSSNMGARSGRHEENPQRQPQETDGIHAIHDPRQAASRISLQALPVGVLAAAFFILMVDGVDWLVIAYVAALI